MACNGGECLRLFGGFTRRADGKQPRIEHGTNTEAEPELMLKKQYPCTIRVSSVAKITCAFVQEKAQDQGSAEPGPSRRIPNASAGNTSWRVAQLRVGKTELQ